jgi:hypothetical protein
MLTKGNTAMDGSSGKLYSLRILCPSVSASIQTLYILIFTFKMKSG